LGLGENNFNSFAFNTSMREKMRQLLSRKSHQKMSDDENRSSRPNGFSSHSDLAGERVFPIRKQGGNGELLTLFPSVKSDGPVSTHFNLEEETR
jgi:hypothetical protein